MANLTDWYPGDVKPVRVGYYERKYYYIPTSNDWWDGRLWRYLEGDAACYNQAREWRGLASDPSKESDA